MKLTNISNGFIGTYTNGESKGIYKFSLDESTGEIKDISLAAEIGSPTYLTLSKNKKYLYSVMKTENEGGVASYLIDSDFNLSLLNYKLSKGPSPCHLITNDDNTYLFSANYHIGEISCYLLNSDGSILDLKSRIFHDGFGTNKERQEKAHAHFVCLTPNEEKLLAIDLGIDKMVVYDYKGGILKEDTSLTVKFPNGTGPRHMTFHKNKKVAFLLSELSCEVFVLKYDDKDNSFNIIQNISALPKDFKEENTAAAIYISNDGKFLYTSNRGHDSIAVFSIDDTSFKLTLVEIVKTFGIHPRDFSIDKSDDFLIVPHQFTDNITIFSRDKITGKLNKMPDEFNISSGVCIKFI